MIPTCPIDRRDAKAARRRAADAETPPNRPAIAGQLRRPSNAAAMTHPLVPGVRRPLRLLGSRR